MGRRVVVLDGNQEAGVLSSFHSAQIVEEYRYRGLTYSFSDLESMHVGPKGSSRGVDLLPSVRRTDKGLVRGAVSGRRFRLIGAKPGQREVVSTLLCYSCFLHRH